MLLTGVLVYFLQICKYMHKYMHKNSQLFSFAECGHRMSKHVDGNNSDRWDNTVHLGIHILTHIDSYCST